MADDYSNFRASIIIPGTPVNQILDTCIESALRGWRAELYTDSSENPPFFRFIFSSTLKDGRQITVETVKVFLGSDNRGNGHAVTVSDGIQGLVMQGALQQ